MSAIKRNDDGISFSCVDFLCALMQPMHDNFDLRQEQLNKRSLLSSKGFLEKLLQPLKDHVVSNTWTRWDNVVSNVQLQHIEPPSLVDTPLLHVMDTESGPE